MAGRTSTRTKNMEKENIPATPDSQSEVVQEEEKKTFKTKTFDYNQIITVYNGFQGRLVYKSRKTGEKFVWDEFGATQDMEFSELRNARSSGKSFFINNWFMFDDPEIVDSLGLTQYYKFALHVNQFDDVFEKDVDELVDIISKLSDGQKKSVAYRAKQLINDGTIDSNRKIAELEKCLGIELVER